MLFFTSEGVQGLPLMSISPDFLVPPSSRHVIMSNRDVFPQPEGQHRKQVKKQVIVLKMYLQNSATSFCLML